MRHSRAVHLVKTVGRPSPARLSRWSAMASAVISRSRKLSRLSEEAFLRRARELRWKAKTDVKLASLLLDAFAMVREASRRTTGMQHFKVQIMGGVALFEGGIAEMQTGEGKTLTATLPAFLRALPGRGCHVVTVNDYLARRDAETMGDVYRQLGLTVGCIQTDMDSDARRREYAADVTYGTAKELGFDLLRDRLRKGAGGESPRPDCFGDGVEPGEAPVQREHYFALVDEADSVLIDEARTPLIIGLTLPNDPAEVNLMRWCDRAVREMEPNRDYVYEPDRRSAHLTEAGCRRVVLMEKPSLLDSIDTERIYSHVEHALTANLGFALDRDYVVVDGKVMIVDESTGRIMDGRKWQDGLHQAVEAKESVPITAAAGQAARITMQSFFREYTWLAGMTGTATTARRELKKAYQLSVTQIPTNMPCIRSAYLPRLFATIDAKYAAVVDEVEQMRRYGRAVLIGTPSVDASEALGRRLKERGIEHEVLNARFHEQEADIVAKAGQSGRVTIATNMAGRGTDIELEEAVREAGGLHVIATEMHSSSRIDRQLVGRSARQGDPGSYQFFLSLEDELLRVLQPTARKALKRRARPDAAGELPRSWLSVFLKTQQVLERTHRKQRKNLLRQEQHRTQQYTKMGLDPYLELTE